MNPYKDAAAEIRRLREISMRTGIPMIMSPETRVGDYLATLDCTPLEDPKHVVDPKERSPIYVDVAMWQVWTRRKRALWEGEER